MHEGWYGFFFKPRSNGDESSQAKIYMRVFSTLMPFYTAKTPYTCCTLSILPAGCNLSTKLSILLSCSNICRLVTTCWNNLQQAADNKFAYICLLTTCNGPVVNNLSQAMRTHPDICLLNTSLLQDVNKLVATCTFFAVQTRVNGEIKVEFHLRLSTLQNLDQHRLWAVLWLHLVSKPYILITVDNSSD